MSTFPDTTEIVYASSAALVRLLSNVLYRGEMRHILSIVILPYDPVSSQFLRTPVKADFGLSQPARDWWSSPHDGSFNGFGGQKRPLTDKEKELWIDTV